LMEKEKGGEGVIMRVMLEVEVVVIEVMLLMVKVKKVVMGKKIEEVLVKMEDL